MHAPSPRLPGIVTAPCRGTVRVATWLPILGLLLLTPSAQGTTDPAPVQAVSKDTPSKPPPTGFLTLRSQPWAKVYVDGKDTGKTTPVMDLVVLAGTREILLVNEASGKSARFTVDVAPGARVRVRRVLTE